MTGVQTCALPISFNPSGTLAYVTNYGGGTVSVINPSTGTVTGTITVGSEPVSVAFNPSGTLAYVTNLGGGTVSVINPSTGLVTGTITVGSSPQGVAFKPLSSDISISNLQIWNGVAPSISSLTQSSPYTYQMGFGGNPVQFPLASGHSSIYTYLTSGTYKVTETTWDQYGGFSTVSQNLPGYANFSANMTTGLYPPLVPIQFTDSSTNSPISWQWGFRNETPGNNTWINGPTTENPVLLFGIGLWDINLTSTNTGGSNTLTRNGYINISWNIPVASFVANKTSGNAPIPISFTDTSVNQPTSWQWGFRNETPGNNTWINGPTTENTILTFQPGKWDVNLTATNGGGSNTSTQIGYLNIINPIPVSSFTSNPSVANDYPMSVQFTDTSTNSPTSWSWNFGDGYTSSLENPIHVYTVANNYTVTLNALNSFNPSYGYFPLGLGYINLTSDLDSNVVSWMHLNSSAVLDLQGNAWAASGGASIDTSTYAFQNGSLYIPDSSSYISSASSNIWNLGVGADEMEFWINPSAPTSSQNIIRRNNGWGFYNSGSASGYGFWMGSISNITSPFTINSGQWHHIVISIGTSQITIYEDGNIVSTGTRPIGSYDNSGFPIVIGGTTTAFHMNEFRMSTGVPRFTMSTFSTPYAQYNGNLNQIYYDINPYATLLYKSYPGTTIIYNTTVGYNRTVQIMNMTNCSAITASLDYNPLLAYASGVTANTTEYPDMQVSGVSIDSINGLVKFTASRPGGAGITAPGTTRVDLADIQLSYVNYTTATSFSTFFDSAFITDGQHGVTYPITYFLPTPVTLGTWQIFTNFTANRTLVLTAQPILFTDLSTGEPSGWTFENWSWGDNTWTNGTAPFSPTHSYVSPGNYTVSLTSSLIANTSVTNTTTNLNYVTVANIPVANFTSSYTNGSIPLLVQFTDTSTNNPRSWLWIFGDGYTSNIQNASHIYNTSGTYEVDFEASNVQGSTWYNKTAYIIAGNTPVASFTGTPTLGAIPLTVNFLDTSTNNPTSWYWSFGDGSNSTSENPTHIYTTPGYYQVDMEAINNTINSSTWSNKTNYISVGFEPVASFVGNPLFSGLTPLTVQFTDTSTNLPTSWYWVFGDGSTSTIENPIHTYIYSGIYNVDLQSSNIFGSTWSNKTSYIAAGLEPIAAFTGTPTSGTVPLTVSFNDLSSNTPTSWYWSFGDGGISTNQNPIYTYNTAGTYEVDMSVSNSTYGTTTWSNQTAYVIVSPMVVSISGTVTSPSNLPLTIQFTGSSTGTPNTWSWSFGDGGTSNQQNPSYTYTAIGTYTVSLISTNTASGASGSLSLPNYIVIEGGGGGGISNNQPPYITLTPTPYITPMPTTTYGAAFDNITQNNFSITYLPVMAIAPFTWVAMGNYTITVFLMLMFVFIAMWFGGGSIRYPTVLGLLFGSMLLFGTGGFGITLPPEIPAISYGIIIASLTGLLISIFKGI